MPSGISRPYKLDESISNSNLQLNSDFKSTLCKHWQTVKNLMAASALDLQCLCMSHKRTLDLYGIILQLPYF